MNTKLLAAVVVAAAVIVGGGVYLATNNHKNTNSSTNNSSQTTNGSSTSSANKKACDLFTLADAKQVMGSSAKVGSTSGATDTSTGDVSVTTCIYDNGASTVGDIETSTVLVRGGLTSTGKSSNQAGFDQGKTTYKTTDVSGLGNGAYYNSDLGQLDVLTSQYWIIITSGGVGASNHSQDQATQIAKFMLAKL